MAEGRVLFVDDEPNVLAAFKRQLHRQYDVETALGGEEALALLERKGPFAVVVADMHMPGMDGVKLLAQVKERAPEVSRVMLTGDTDQRVAIDAVNEGAIFRFVTKPCPTERLTQVLDESIDRHRAMAAERQTLDRTLRGSVKMLIDILSMTNPTAFGRASRIQRLIRPLCAELKIDNAWQIEVGAMLSQVGCVALSEETLSKAYKGQRLSDGEARLFAAHPAMARDLIANIPRLEPIAEIVYYQEKRYDGSGIPEDSAAGERIPLGARILKLALDYDALSPSGVFSPEAFSALERRSGWYDPALLKTFHKTLRERADGELKSLVTHDMEKSVRSSVQVLMDVLSLANPTASARASRILRIAHMICQELQAPNAWQIDVAAMLSQVGCVSTPEDILAKAYRGETLSEEETRVFQTHPRVGRDLIARIPRLEPVAKIVEYQEKHFDGLGVPLDEIAGERIPLGARVLKLALDYDTLAPSGTFQADAFEKIERREGWYDPAVVRALRRALRAKGRYELAELRPAEMNVDMIVGEDVRDAEGRLLVAKGQELTSALLSFLRGYSGHPTVNRRIQTLVPIEAKRIEGR